MTGAKIFVAVGCAHSFHLGRGGEEDFVEQLCCGRQCGPMDTVRFVDWREATSITCRSI